MTIRLGLLALALTACHPLPPPRAATDDATAVEPKEQAHFALFKFLQRIGVERDSYTPTADGGSDAKAVFTFNDRGTDVPLAATFHLGADGLPLRFDAWGDTARGTPIDDHVRALGDGRFSIRRLGAATRTATVAAPYAASSGYAPMLGQELLVRTWVARGRPAKIALLPEGEARIESRGKESYTLDGKSLTFEHLAIHGLVWGREDVWLDDKGKLAAVVTRDAEFDHFEGARVEYATLVEALVGRAGSDAVAGLAEAVRATGGGAGGVTALVGARLIDGSGAAAVEDSVVVFDGDRIVAAGPRATTPIPAGARRVDVTGKSIIPGLWDMHAHVEQVEQMAAYLAAGVTTVRDEGNILSFITSVRDAIESGRGIGPRVIVDGIVDSTAKRAIGTVRVDEPSDIVPLVERLKSLGCAEVKIYSSVKPALVAPLVAEAHKRGLRVTGHIPFGMDLQEALDAGFDGVNHVDSFYSMVMPKSEAEFLKLSRDERGRRMSTLDLGSPVMERVFAKMAANKVAFDPTLALYELWSYPLAELTRREPGLAKMPAVLRSAYNGVDPESAAYHDALFRKQLDIVREAHRRGIPVVAGTDIAVLGHSLHREIALYASAGFTPLEALQAATLVPARALGRDGEVGTIAAGKRADLVVVDGNPLVNIADTRKVTLVVARGRAYEPAQLWKLAGFQP